MHCNQSRLGVLLGMVVVACGGASDMPRSAADAMAFGGRSAAGAPASRPVSGTALTPITASSSPAASVPQPRTASAAGAPAPVPQLGAACGTLLQCCGTQLDAASKRACQIVVEAAREPDCTTVSAAYCGARAAIAPPATPSTQSPAADACAALAPCCAAQDDEDAQDACQAIADAADALACQTQSSTYCPSAQPATNAGVCDQLATCCTSLRDEDARGDCEEVAGDGDATACQTSLGELCPTVQPMTASTPAAGGAPATDACAMLALCCNKLEDDDDREECQRVVDARAASDCQSALAHSC